jgi:hypothetical protein
MCNKFVNKVGSLHIFGPRGNALSIQICVYINISVLVSYCKNNAV